MTPALQAAAVLPLSAPIALRDSSTAQARALAYALFSNLLASPFETAVSYSLSDLARQLTDIADLLPFDFNAADIEDALAHFDDTDQGRVRRDYSGLFEVGSDGPPVPLRAELVRTNESVAKEEIVRFYEHFNYALDARHQWAPDHLSILLEFMQTLALGEARAAGVASLLSFRLAQRDFTARHIADWMPGLIAKLHRSGAEQSFFGAVVSALARFIRADLAWQIQTLDAADQGI